MPLSSAQQDHIQASIGHLLNPPADAKELPREITRIRQAFIGDELPPNHDYRFIQRPTEYLLRLEDAGPPTTIGEVKMQILNLASQRITEAAAIARLQLTPNDWDREQLQKQITESKDFKSPFVSVRPQQVIFQPPLYPIPIDNNQIYRAHIEVTDTYDATIVCIEIMLTPDNVASFTFNYAPIPVFLQGSHDEAEDAFLKKTALNCREFAERKAISFLLNHLMIEKIISSKEEVSQHVGILLTYEAYFNLLVQGKISFSDISRLTRLQVSTLIQPPLLRLINEGKSDISRLKDLKPSEVKVLEEPYLIQMIENEIYSMDTLSLLTKEQRMVASDPYYAPLILNGRLPLSDIIPLSAEQCKCMLLPVIVHLNKEGKIQLKQIYQMTEGTRSVTSDAYYSALLMKKKLEYSLIENLSPETGKALISPAIITLISNQIIDIKDIKTFNLSVLQMIAKDPIIYHLMNNKILTLNDVILITRDTIETHWPDEYKAKPLSPEQITSFKPLLQEFIKLSENGLLYDNDLHYLYCRLEHIQKELKNNPSKDEKNSEGAFKLLTSQGLLKRCHMNIKNRIYTILDTTNGVKSNDSIDKIKSACNQFDVDFSGIRNKIFDDYFMTHFLSPNKYSFNKVYLTGLALGMTRLEIYEQTFGKRLFLLFDQQPLKRNKDVDTQDKLIADIEADARIHGTSALEIQNITICYLLKKIKASLQEKPKFSEHMGAYTEICEKIREAETVSHQFIDEKNKNSMLAALFSLARVKADLASYIPGKTGYSGSYHVFHKSQNLFLSKPRNALEELNILRKKFESVARYVVITQAGSSPLITPPTRSLQIIVAPTTPITTTIEPTVNHLGLRRH